MRVVDDASKGSCWLSVKETYSIAGAGSGRMAKTEKAGRERSHPFDFYAKINAARRSGKRLPLMHRL